eukprot:Plantae.Rhodophyta-Hildenbrandia_rubra.ctg4903.p1 GENE.Plantae.Rhodophyta-Hildenbrandia_rubra.ctg4903~~Plantae.Rhodophyta-Hildenbrandia_rubra.ctg4903.p1  ORF type:complete len:554 (-),score=78.65 Plantae.Rhodophyta-Hildenbrandia_rubra.ctg4903:1387-3048(-)
MTSILSYSGRFTIMLPSFNLAPGCINKVKSWYRHHCTRPSERFGVSPSANITGSSTTRTSGTTRMLKSGSKKAPEMNVETTQEDGPDGNGVTKKDVDVVLCHQMTDFDSLGCAVGLSKLRGPETLVVCPGGEHPTVKRFLALHRQLFRIVSPKLVDTERLRFVGVVDTTMKARLGVTAEWPSMAEEVQVYDHHPGSECDITNEKSFKLVVDDVGALATLITEKLVEADIDLTTAEATLLALAIHADTGSLTFEQTTARDAKMLCWLMEHGANQRSISEFTHASLTDSQQHYLSQGLAMLQRKVVNGCEIGSVVLTGNSFLRGMADVAQDILDLSNIDVLLLCHIYCRGREQQRNGNGSITDLKQLSIIGRASSRAQGVDFREAFGTLGGGGHSKAASANIKGSESDAHKMMSQLIDSVAAQIPEATPVRDVMQSNVHTIALTESTEKAKNEMKKRNISGLPVLNEDNHVVGVIASHDIRLAEKRQGSRGLELPVSAWMHHKVLKASPGTPLHVAEHLMTDNAVGRLPVVDDDEKIIGIITRTDILVHKGLHKT